MQARVNAFQQPIGPDVAGWTARPRCKPESSFPTTHRPRRRLMARPRLPLAPAEGRYCRLEPLSAARHAAELYQAFSQAPDGRDWTMSVGPLPARPSTAPSPSAPRRAGPLAPRRHRPGQRQGRGHAVADAHRSGQWRDRGGFVSFSPLRTRIATEAQFLDAARVRRAGLQALRMEVRQPERASRSAARLGFEFEGVFRQAGLQAQPRHGLAHHRQRRPGCAQPTRASGRRPGARRLASASWPAACCRSRSSTWPWLGPAQHQHRPRGGADLHHADDVGVAGPLRAGRAAGWPPRAAAPGWAGRGGAGLAGAGGGVRRGSVRCADWCSLTAAFGWAGHGLPEALARAGRPRVVVTAWQLSIGALCALAGMLLAGESFPQGWSVRVAGADFHIVLGTAAAYWLWFVLSERISATGFADHAGGAGGGRAGRHGVVGDRPAAQDWWGFALVLAGAADGVGSVGAAAARLSRPGCPRALRPARPVSRAAAPSR